MKTAMMEVGNKPKVTSILIHVVNDFTAPVDYLYKGHYLKNFSVKISQGAHRPRFSNQGICYFINVPDGDYSLLIEAEDFVSQHHQVSVVAGTIPEIAARLKPDYYYKFPAIIPYIRGKVVDSVTNRPLAGVRIKAAPRAEEAVSDEMGLYNVYFQEAVIDAGESINLTFQKTGYVDSILPVSIAPMKKVTNDVVKMDKV